MKKKNAIAFVSAASAVLALPFAYHRAFTPWQRHWGATLDEQLRVMPGDEFVLAPDYVTTRAITVDAPPEAVYPWLVQMGYQRGGLYSYDFLDRIFGFLDAPSSRVILPQFQDLKPGDEIPVGRGKPFPVRDLKKDEYLLLAGEEKTYRWTWSTALYPTGDGQTRLVTRNMGSGMGRGFTQRVMLFGIDMAAFVMVRRWLQVLKGRAETLYWETPVDAAAATPVDGAAV